MEKQKSAIAIKIVIFILLVLLIMLIPIKALAADAPTFTVSSSLNECYDGDAATITIEIYNDTGVDIMPTSYYLDGSYYTITSGFMSPWQSLTITKNHTVHFNGAQSVSYDIHLIYHEDGDYDTFTAWETVTITKKSLTIITPIPMTIITPVPETTPMGLITPQPSTPDLGSMAGVTPTPGNGLDDVSVLTPAPANLPQSTPQPTEYPQQHADNQEIVVLIDTTHGIYTQEDIENHDADTVDASNYRISSVLQGENIKTIITQLDNFTKICLVVIVILLVGYILLTIRLKRQK